MKMIITLSPKEVKEIVKKHLHTKFKTVGEIELEVGEIWMGHGMSEYQSTVFKGATTEVEL